MFEVIGIVSGLVATVGLVPYVIDIVKGKTRPERASWLIWGVLGIISFFSQLADGASASLWMTGFQVLNVILIFVLSLKWGQGGLSKHDLVAMGFALFGIILWKLTNNPNLALVIVIFVDMIGVYLTFIKAVKDPGSETLSAWVLASISGVLGAVAVGRFDISLLSYPVYISLANSLIVLAIVLGRKRM